MPIHSSTVWEGGRGERCPVPLGHLRERRESRVWINGNERNDEALECGGIPANQIASPGTLGGGGGRAQARDKKGRGKVGGRDREHAERKKTKHGILKDIARHTWVTCLTSDLTRSESVPTTMIEFTTALFTTGSGFLHELKETALVVILPLA